MGKKRRPRPPIPWGKPVPNPLAGIKPSPLPAGVPSMQGDCKVIGDAPDINRWTPGLTYHSTWSSPEAFSRHIRSLDESKAWQDAGWDDGDGGFRGTKTMAEALDLAQEGWKEGGNLVARLRDTISAMHPLAPKPIVYGIVGSTPNVPRAVAGNILNMRTTDLSRSRKRPIITLWSEMSSLCHVDKDAISNRAAVVAAIIDQIESVGFSCEVISSASTDCRWTTNSPRMATSVMVKEAGQGADAQRLAFGLGHSAMFRRMVFADWGSDHDNKRIGKGLGSGHPVKKESLLEQKIYYLPGAGSNEKAFATEAAAATLGLQYMINILRTQGCPAFPKLNTDGEIHEEMEDDEEISVPSF